MSKFVRLRVDVPVDDDLLVDQVRDHMRAFLEERGTESLALAHTESNGGAALSETLMPRMGRIHWPAVAVVMHAERVPAAPKAPMRNAQRRSAGGPANE
jgi:hypothetical protein